MSKRHWQVIAAGGDLHDIVADRIDTNGGDLTFIMYPPTGGQRVVAVFYNVQGWFAL